MCLQTSNPNHGRLASYNQSCSLLPCDVFIKMNLKLDAACMILSALFKIDGKRNGIIVVFLSKSMHPGIGLVASPASFGCDRRWRVRPSRGSNSLLINAAHRGCQLDILVTFCHQSSRNFTSAHVCSPPLRLKIAEARHGNEPPVIVDLNWIHPRQRCKQRNSFVLVPIKLWTTSAKAECKGWSSWQRSRCRFSYCRACRHASQCAFWPHVVCLSATQWKRHGEWLGGWKHCYQKDRDSKNLQDFLYSVDCRFPGLTEITPQECAMVPAYQWICFTKEESQVWQSGNMLLSAAFFGKVGSMRRSFEPALDSPSAWIEILTPSSRHKADTSQWGIVQLSHEYSSMSTPWSNTLDALLSIKEGCTLSPHPE